jgi:hypothetical protein
LFSRESKISILRPIMAGRRIRIKKAKITSKEFKLSPYIISNPPRNKNSENFQNFCQTGLGKNENEKHFFKAYKEIPYKD